MDFSNLTIGYDAKRAVCNNTGLGNYSRLVIDVLSEEDHHPYLKLYTPDPSRRNNRLDPLLKREGVELTGPKGILWKHLNALWRVSGGITSQIKTDGVALFHGLSNELPLDIPKAGIPSVVTIHDVIFHRQKDNYKPVDRLIYDFKWRHAIANATRIIAISECTKRDIIELYHADPDKIDVIYQGCHPVFCEPVTPADIDRVSRTYNLPKRYIATVGTIEPRKNQLQAVKALPYLDNDIKLVIVGRGREPYASRVITEARRSGVEDRIIRLDGVPLSDLPAIYAGAFAASYTSRYEGFGLPVIEALNTRTPVIAAKGSCLEEAGGTGAIYVDPDNVGEFVEAAKTIAAHGDIALRMASEGNEYVRRFSRANLTSGLLNSYSRAIEEFGRVARIK